MAGIEDILGGGMDDMWANFRMSPAEIAVLNEQIETIKAGLNQISIAAGKNDGKTIHDTWHMVGATCEYMNALLSARGHYAMHAAMEGRTNDE